MTDESSTATLHRDTAYGRVIREQGTRNLVIAAIVIFVIWYAYSAFQTNRLNQVKWPPLEPSKQGLTVLGLLDQERDGVKPRYIAISANKAWQIRYREDSDAGGDYGGDEERPEGGTNPAASRSANRGSIVPLEEMFARLPTVLTSRHFLSARVEQRPKDMFDRTYWVVHIELSDEGRSRYWQFSRVHDGEKLVFLLDGEVSICPIMRHMNTSSLTLEQYWVKADADRLAEFINRKK